MVSNSESRIRQSLTRMESFFVPGGLADKRDEIIRLRGAGDTAFFEGGVKWYVTLPACDKRMRGVSESLDSAFGDMEACLLFLSQAHDNDTQVVCGIEAAGETGGKDAP